MQTCSSEGCSTFIAEHDQNFWFCSVGDKIRIAKLFAAESHQHALAAEALGFLGKPAPVQKAQTLLNVQLLNGLTFDERMKAIEAEVSARPMIGEELLRDEPGTDGEGGLRPVRRPG